MQSWKNIGSQSTPNPQTHACQATPMSAECIAFRSLLQFACKSNLCLNQRLSLSDVLERDALDIGVAEMDTNLS